MNKPNLKLSLRARIGAAYNRVLDWLISPITRHATDETYYSCRTRWQLIKATLSQ